MENDIRYNRWMAVLNGICFTLFGVIFTDLPDMNDRPLYDAGLSPREALKELMNDHGVDIDDNSTYWKLECI